MLSLSSAKKAYFIHAREGILKIKSVHVNSSVTHRIKKQNKREYPNQAEARIDFLAV
jgi:hypothetical protein